METILGIVFGVGFGTGVAARKAALLRKREV